MRNFKILVLMTALSLTAIGIATASDLSIESDRQTFKMEQNKASFDGNVRVKMDDITATSPRAEVMLDPKTKQLSDAYMYDKPYVIQIKQDKRNEIKSNILKMSLLNKKIKAEGNTQTTVTETKTGKPSVIITADSQEYDTNTKTLTAQGSVIIYYKDVETFSNNAVAVLNQKGDLQKITLIGNGKLKQKDSIITAEKFIYDAVTETAYAIGKAHSNVNMDGTRINVWSARQEYNKTANILQASGNVHVIYKDYDAKGPKATVYPDSKTGRLNEIVFIGRSVITEQMRSIEADRIKMYINPKNFFAEGNVKTVIRNVDTQQSRKK
jgi:lipopolysaccharide export system protein LptA